MRNNTKYLARAALIAALYAALTYLQYFLFPHTTSMAVQFRISEALCVLALFTPAAIPGLTIGCLLFNIVFAGSLPLDWLVGSLATLLAVWGMWKLRRFPWLTYAFPAITNATLVGWELTAYFPENTFWFNALCVALGELGVLYTLGALLAGVIRKRNLDGRLFS